VHLIMNGKMPCHSKLETSPFAGSVPPRRSARTTRFSFWNSATTWKCPALSLVVLTRDSAIAYLWTVTVAPITSTIRGVPSEVVLEREDGMRAPCAVTLHNPVTVSHDRFGKCVAQLSSLRMNEICAALRFSLGCDIGPS